MKIQDQGLPEDSSLINNPRFVKALDKVTKIAVQQELLFCPSPRKTAAPASTPPEKRAVIKIYVPIFCRKYSCRSRRTSSNLPPPGFDSIIFMRRQEYLCSQRRGELQGDDGLGIIDFAFKKRLMRFGQIGPDRFEHFFTAGRRRSFRNHFDQEEMNFFIAKSRRTVKPGQLSPVFSPAAGLLSQFSPGAG